MTCDEKKESTSATTSAKPKKMIVVGGGLAGLSAAAALMKAGLVQMGHEVIVRRRLRIRSLAGSSMPVSTLPWVAAPTFLTFVKKLV